MARALGTNHIVHVATAGTKGGAQHMASHFAKRARQIGTVRFMREPTITKAGVHDWEVTFDYEHTCRNKGNALSDARRFVRNAMKDTTFRWSDRPHRQYPWRSGE